MNRTFLFFLLLCVACGKPTSKDNRESAQDQEPEAETTMDQNPESDTEQVGTMVYVTHAGDKYHTADCRYSKTANTTTLQKAKADGLTACGICKPNSKSGEKQLRCSATTTEGKRCQRMTTDASGKCFQHRG